ncbi:hypothetical protein [Archangium lipolyticum]|uniref:hypothetical protein n=1 Tax=Archangium lipolyticum TaxID=2970465 RepID=UPI002149F32C|nr:hypothetical protein [Archangium lipolyticum]
MSAPHAPWRNDPGLVGHFHPEYPDDLQVIVHDGEPRRTQRAPESCWVRVTGMEPAILRPVIYEPEENPLSREVFDARYRAPSPVFVGALINQPHHLKNVKQGDEIRFLVVPGLPLPLHVTREYLRERPQWDILPCNQCGGSECFDPPSVLYRTRFPGTPPDAVPEMFTAFCSACGGTMALSNREAGAGRDEEASLADEPSAPAPAKKPWWKVW